MGSEADVVEISSDEEEEEAAEGEKSAGWDPSGSPSIDWVDEFLEGVDGEELDDVVVLEEKSSKSCAAAEVRSPRGTGDDSDDDCLMLDGDPDGQMSAVDGDKSGVGDGSDELIIVGEKGQLACRDYPHPRHLCANFPFKSSPHEKYCGMCHCFVCDSPAPCQYWGNGISSTDHCHSTDKEARWKNERKSFKQRNMPTPDPSKLLNASPVMPPFLNPQLIPCNDPIIIPNPSSISNPLRSCPVTRSVPVPAVTSQKHHQGSLVAALRSQRIARRTPKTSPLVPMPRVQIERYRSGSIAAPIMHSHTKFKRTATPSTHPVHLNSSRCQTAVSSRNQTYRAAAPPRTQCPPVTSSEDGVKFWQDILAEVATELGVAEDTSRSTTVGQPYAVTSQSTLGLFHSQMIAETQDIGLANKSTPALTDTSQSCFDSSWLNDTTAQNNPDFEQLASKSNCSVFGSNIVSGNVILDNFMGNVEQETVPEPVNKSGLLDMDPVSLLYDLDCSWNT